MKRYALLLLAGSACSNEASWQTGTTSDTVIYGDDSRVAPAALDGPGPKAAVVNSTVALIPEPFLRVNQAGWFELYAPTVAEVFGLCPSEALANAPAGAVCTGIVVAENVVATAAHCVADQAQCESLLFVLGFLWGSWDSQVQPAAIHNCRRLLYRRHDRCSDLALIELEQPIPLAVEFAEGLPTQGQPLIACGASLGTPIRCDPQGVAQNVDGSTLVLAADVAIGASGGPVLAVDGKLVGMLVDGAPDFEPSQSCFVEATRSDSGVERAVLGGMIQKAMSEATNGQAVESTDSQGRCDTPLEDDAPHQCSVRLVRGGTSVASPWTQPVPGLLGFLLAVLLARRRGTSNARHRPAVCYGYLDSRVSEELGEQDEASFS